MSTCTRCHGSGQDPERGIDAECSYCRSLPGQPCVDDDGRPRGASHEGRGVAVIICDLCGEPIEDGQPCGFRVEREQVFGRIGDPSPFPTGVTPGRRVYSHDACRLSKPKP